MDETKKQFEDNTGYGVARLLAMKGEITTRAFLTYHVLRDHAGKKLVTWYKVDDIAKEMNVHRDTVNEATNELVKIGLIEVIGNRREKTHKNGRHNNYVFRRDYTEAFKAVKSGKTGKEALTKPETPEAKEAPKPVKIQPAPQTPLKSKPSAITTPSNDFPSEAVTIAKRFLAHKAGNVPAHYWTREYGIAERMLKTKSVEFWQHCQPPGDKINSLNWFFTEYGRRYVREQQDKLTDHEAKRYVYNALKAQREPVAPIVPIAPEVYQVKTKPRNLMDFLAA